jgi:hypothetical protein
MGLRCLVILVEAFPDDLDLQRMVTLDYLLVHSGDIAGGPESLHPPSPLRAGEVAVRRGLIEDGLTLYRGRGLVAQRLSSKGITYVADDSAGAFLDGFSSRYVTALRDRAEWIFDSFGLLESRELNAVLRESIGQWRTEFAVLALGEGDP